MRHTNKASTKQQSLLKRQDEDERSRVKKRQQKQKNKQLASILHSFTNSLTEQEEGKSYRKSHKRYLPPNYKRNQQEVVPNQKEIKESLDLLKSAFPKQSINQVVSLLYNNLVRKNEKGEERAQTTLQQNPFKPKIADQRNWYRNSSVLQFQSNIKSVGKIENSISYSKTFPKDDNYRAKYSKPVDQQKYIKKHFIAQVICNRDYGITALEEYIAQSKCKLKMQRIVLCSDRMEYKTTAFSIATEAYRKIEEFLIKVCSRKIKPINREQLRSMFRILLNCRVYFQPEDSNTLLKFISAVYGLSTVTITGAEAMKLYIAIQETLKIRITQKHVEPITQREGDTFKTYRPKNCDKPELFQLDKIWNRDFQMQLLQLYRRDQNFVHIRDFFAKVYPENQEIFNMQAIRVKFGKIIRSSLKKLTTIISKNLRLLPPLVKLTDLRTKFLQRSPECLNVRFVLMDFYTEQSQQDLNRVKEIIDMINESIQAKERDNPYTRKYVAEDSKPKQNPIVSKDVEIEVNEDLDLDFDVDHF